MKLKNYFAKQILLHCKSGIESNKLDGSKLTQTKNFKNIAIIQFMKSKINIS